MLLSALSLSSDRPLPDWVFITLSNLLIERQPKVSKAEERWHLARILLDQSPGDPEARDEKPPLKWEEVWLRASKILALAGRPAKPRTVRASYELIERSLPPAQRRPLTWVFDLDQSRRGKVSKTVNFLNLIHQNADYGNGSWRRCRPG